MAWAVMEGFGPEKLIFILLVVMLIFGAKRLPEIGSGLGKGIREFKKSVRGDEEMVPQAGPPPVAQMPVQQFQAPTAPAALQSGPAPVAQPVQRTETTQA